MVQAVSSNLAPSASRSDGAQPGTAAALQAELDKYEKQLSDCVNCASAKTEAGKQNIQEISQKIGDLKTQLKQLPTTDAPQKSASADLTLPKDNANQADGSPRPGAATLSLGGFLDVKA
jgi:hypothetical protein